MKAALLHTMSKRLSRSAIATNASTSAWEVTSVRIGVISRSAVHCRESSVVDIGRDDVGSNRHESLDRGQPDATGRASDDHHSPV
jgi:hypothetical protein